MEPKQREVFVFVVFIQSMSIFDYLLNNQGALSISTSRCKSLLADKRVKTFFRQLDFRFFFTYQLTPSGKALLRDTTLEIKQLT